MKRNIILFAIALMPIVSTAQTAADVGNAAKAGAVTEAMRDSVVEPGREEAAKDDKPVKRNSMVVFTSAFVVIMVAVVAARRRKRNQAQQ